MKVKLANKLVYIEYQSLVNNLIEIIEDIIPDKINEINIEVELEFCNGYNKPDSLTSNLNIVLHIFMAGYINKIAVSRNLHRRFIFSPVNLKAKRIDKVVEIQIMQLLLLIIKFAKTGELTTIEETGETYDFF